jgi:hypothetical protein
MRYSLVYGGLAGIIIIVVSTAFVTAGLLGHSSSPLMGYLAMLVGLTMIFVGVKRYRDAEQGGVITFGKALIVGLGISLIAAIIYAAAFEIYAALSGFDLTAHFSEITQREMQSAGASQSAIDRELAALREFGEAYRNPLVRIPIHFLEIGPVCLLVSLVSAAILRNPRVLPARAA